MTEHIYRKPKFSRRKSRHSPSDWRRRGRRLAEAVQAGLISLEECQEELNLFRRLGDAVPQDVVDTLDGAIRFKRGEIMAAQKRKRKGEIQPVLLDGRNYD